MKKIYAIGLMAALAGSAAYAQEAPALAEAQLANATADQDVTEVVTDSIVIPEIYQAIPGLKAAGTIAGMNAWSADGQQLIFMEDPDNGNMIVGYAFDPEGANLVPELAGVEEANLTSLLTSIFSAQVQIPEQYAPTIEQRLGALPEAERQAAVNTLIESLRGVEGEAAFNAAIEAWIALLPEAEATEPASAEPAPAVDAPAEPAPAEPPAAAPAETPAETAPEAQQGDAGAATDAAASPDDQAAADEGPTLIEALRNAAWIDIGNPQAPLVYALMDPACDPCRAALRELDGQITDGELQVRAIFLPAVGEDSTGVIAGLMIEDNPAEALMALARDEAAELPFARPSTMSDAVMGGLKTNYDIAVAYQVPQLPFFAFETTGEPGYISGVPSAEQLAGAILSDLDVRQADEAAPAADVEVPVEAVPAETEAAN